MPNRLASETSPYLLQHADNPVEWYPWGEEALERARNEDRPILLSIGYSACHWCHVMERESFEDDETARLMNETFVNVKVDREERPDLDSIYMRAVQALTGRGGWPLTAFLTPAGEPYYGGTYFPPEPRHGMPSFRQVLTAARDAWRDRPEDVADAAGQLRGVLERSTAGGRGRSEAAALTPPVLDAAYRSLAGSFDPVHGGFGAAPKFPQPVVLEFLLRSHVRTGESAPLTMVTHTLRSMARGGVRDHLAGGFHRYAVDARWLVPHFEKMLYDNALLARVYLNAWQLTREPDLREVAEEVLDYLLDDLRSAEGGFFAARDADSEGEEGRYYVWSAEEVDGVLERAEARLFRRVYDVSESGNFEGSNILHLPHDLDAVARAEGTEPAELKARLRAARERLLERREGRPEPLKDTKVLTGWNGMTARALAEAGGALDREDYREAAAACADFLLQRLREGDRLLHVWTDGRAKVDGFLEDYGALGNALLTLWETTLDPRWLPEVRWTCDRVVELFWDPEEEAFYDAPEGGERLVVRPRDPMDTATPSGTSLAVELLLRAAALFGNEDWSRLASRALLGEADGMARFPSAFGRLLSCADRHLAAPVEVAVLGPPGDPRTRALHRAALRPWLPNRVLAGADPEAAGELGLPLLSGRGLRDGSPAAYVCRNYACGEPVTEAEALEEQLGPSGSGV